MSFRHPSLTFARSFTTTPALPARPSMSQLTHIHRNIPAYPHGRNYWYKQSNFGLYGNTRIQFGNSVSAEHGVKNRRKWEPNIQHKRLWSEALNRFLDLKVHTRVLRTIDKCGGVDEYLLGGSKARIRELGMEGWRLRWKLMQTGKVKKRWEVERAELKRVELERVELERAELERVELERAELERVELEASEAVKALSKVKAPRRANKRAKLDEPRTPMKEKEEEDHETRHVEPSA